jgi:hypothetical protein
MGGKSLLPLLLLLMLAACSGDPNAPAPARLALSSEALDFGPVTRGTALALPVTVRNTGESETRVGAFTIDGPDAAMFSVVGPASIAIGPGQEALVEIRFTPAALGPKTARFWMIGGDNDTLKVRLSGLGSASVVARLVSSPPMVDGDGSDPAWGIPIPLELRFEQLASVPIDPFSSPSNRPPFSGALRALYTADSLYLLLSWNDPSADVAPDVWQLGSGGWSRRRTGDDGASLIFPITAGPRAFEQKGCATSCHAAASLDRYEEGHRSDDGAIDLWYWRAGLSDPLGSAWDQWADASTGRRPDVPADRPEPNYATTGATPLRVWGGDNGGLDPRFFLWQPTSIDFPPSGPNPLTGGAWQIGDSIPGWILPPAVRREGGIRARGMHRNGVWTVEFARALSTGESEDVEFDIRNDYHFSIAVHDRQRKFSSDEYRFLPSAANPSHYGIYLIGLIFD